MESKREVPNALKTILQWDIELTKQFQTKIGNKYLPYYKYKDLFKFVEISCHGIPWLAGSLLLVFLMSSTSIQNFGLNLMFALILDMVVVAFIKASARRRRPSNNRDDMFATYSVDKFSFPSGHATRAVMFCFLLPSKSALFYYLSPLLMVWAVLVCISRVQMNRHYILDVIGGITIGWVEAQFIKRLFWMSVPFTNWIVSHLFFD